MNGYYRTELNSYFVCSRLTRVNSVGTTEVTRSYEYKNENRTNRLKTAARKTKLNTAFKKWMLFAKRYKSNIMH